MEEACINIHHMNISLLGEQKHFLYVFDLWHVALKFWMSVMNLVILHFSLKCRHVFTDTILILCFLDSMEMHLLLLRPKSSLMILYSVSSSNCYTPPLSRFPSVLVFIRSVTGIYLIWHWFNIKQHRWLRERSCAPESKMQENGR